MDDAVKVWEKPAANEKYLIAGWHQWADAGSISSGLPQYLIEHTQAKKVGEFDPEGFYIFQVPGTHHLLRPEVKLQDGFPQEMRTQKNELFYSGDDDKGLFIFLGDEPHMDADRYADAFFDFVEALEIKRVIALGGVYGSMPYDKDRNISCVYSLTSLREELSNYAVRFSNYEGGTTIGTYLLDQAERRQVELVGFYGFVPAYDFSQLIRQDQGLRIDNDYKAWYDLMRRINHMLGLSVNLSDLDELSNDLRISMDVKIAELANKAPQLDIRAYLDKVAEAFTERTFMPLDDVWKRELDDLFEDLED